LSESAIAEVDAAPASSLVMLEQFAQADFLDAAV